VISAWDALYDLFSEDATLAALLATNADTKPAIYPHMREAVEGEGDFPTITTPGASGESRLNKNQADVEISTWVTVLTSEADPEGKRHAIDERMVALADATIRSRHAFSGVRISVRTFGMRDIAEPDRLRRRRIWSVGVA